MGRLILDIVEDKPLHIDHAGERITITWHRSRGCGRKHVKIVTDAPATAHVHRGQSEGPKGGAPCRAPE